MLEKIRSSQYFCGLDLGTHAIKASLVRVKDEENLDLLGVSETRADGFKGTSISDITQLADSLRQAVHGLGRKTGIKVTQVQLGIGGHMLSARRTSCTIPLVDGGTRLISAFDVRKVNHQAKLLGVGLDEEVIHDFPQWYKVDDVNSSINPAGLIGRKIESNLLLLTVNSVRLRNVIKAVHQSGFEIGSLKFCDFAASDVVLSLQDKQEGCALMDIGAHITSVLFFNNGIVGDVQFIPWGGHYITQSLAERLNLTVDLAEDIKKTHAVALGETPQNIPGEILIKRDKGYIPIPRLSVYEVVNWEIENLLTHLEAVVRGSYLYHQLNKGIVMIGGGALLPGLLERIEDRLNVSVLMGAKTKGLNNASVYAASIGLARMHYLKKKAARISLATPKNLKNKIVTSVRELCQEYF